MPNKLTKSIRVIAGLWLALACCAGATEPAAPPYQLLISVPEQKLAVVFDGELVAKYPVSTSRFGTGDDFWSYKTPLGELKVFDKIGENLPAGTVIRHRSATGEILPVNAPGRDPIVTRLIWLEGLEAQNKNARRRDIYIHGTPEEKTIGSPVSWGCIRMRSRDVIAIFDEVPVGTVVSIIPGKLPHMHKYEPPKIQPEPAVPVVAATQAPAEQAKPAAAPEKAPENVAQQPAGPLPPIGESPDHESDASWPVWRALKGSFLLANIPILGSDKDHKKAQ